MPFIREEDSPAPGPRLPTGVVPPNPVRPYAGEVFAAGMLQENSLVNLARRLHEGTYPPDPMGHNAMDILKLPENADILANHSDLFPGSQSVAETHAKIRRIREEMARKEMLESAGGLGVLAGITGGVFDPIALGMPGGVIIKAGKTGYRAVKSGFSVGAAGALGSSVTESILQGTQETRSLGESAVAIGSATLLSAIIGAGASKVGNWAETAKMVRALDHERNLARAHIDGTPPPVSEAPAPARAPEAVPGMAAAQAAQPAPARTAGEIVGELHMVFRDQRGIEDVSPQARAIYDALPEDLKAAGMRGAEEGDVGGIRSPEGELIDVLDDEALAEAQALPKTPNPLYPAFVKHINAEAEKAVQQAVPAQQKVPVVRGGPEIETETPPTQPDMFATPMARAAGAAATDTRELQPVGYLFDKIPGWSRIARFIGTDLGAYAAKSVVGRRHVSTLWETSMQFIQNRERSYIDPVTGETRIIPATATADVVPLDSEVRLIVETNKIKIGDELKRLYKDYRFGTQDVTAPYLQAEIRGRIGEPTGKMLPAEFEREVSVAANKNDTHAIPQIAEAAAFIRKTLFDPISTRMEAANPDFKRMEPKEGESYFPRVANKQMIAARTPEFVDTVILPTLQEQQATKAAAKERLIFFNAQLNSWDAQIQKLEDRLARVEGRTTILDARAGERSREAARTAERATDLRDRVNTITADVEDLSDSLVTLKDLARLYPESDAPLRRARSALERRLERAKVEEANAKRLISTATKAEDRVDILRERSEGVAAEVAELEEVVALNKELVRKNPQLAEPLRRTEAMLERRITKARGEQEKASEAARNAAGMEKLAESALERATRITGEAKELAAAADQMDEVLSRYPKLGPVVAELKRRLDARIATKRVEGARGSEAGRGAEYNRRRLAALEEQLGRAEDRKALIEDYLVVADEMRTQVRTKIEEEIAAWEGKSAGEAKAALKAREKAEAARTARIEAGEFQGEAGRLQSADKAIDSAVRSIIKSDRDLSVEDLRALAQEIANHYMGTPIGRFPYDFATTFNQRPNIANSELRGSMKARDFDIPYDRIAPWLNHDLNDVLSAYQRTMVPDLLLWERYPGEGPAMTSVYRSIEDDYESLKRAAGSEKASKRLNDEKNALIKTIADVVERTRGISNNVVGMSGRVGEAVRRINQMTDLGFAGVVSLTDMAGPLAMHGLNNTFNDGWKPFIQYLGGDAELARASKAELRRLNIGGEIETASRGHAFSEISENYNPTTKGERVLKAASDKFFLMNFQAQETEFAKRMAGRTAMMAMMRAIGDEVAGRATKKQITMLRASNITPEMSRRIWDQFNAPDGGTTIKGERLTNTDNWTDERAKMHFMYALNRDVNRAVVTPGAEKPIWLSSNVGSLLGQYKSFSVAAFNKILVANLQQADAQSLQFVLGSLAMATIAYRLTTLLQNRPWPERPQDLMKEVVARSGLTPIIEDINMFSAKATGGTIDMYRLIGADKPLSRGVNRTLLSSVMGPTAGKFETIVRLAGAATIKDKEGKRVGLNEADIHAGRRLIAYQNLLGWNLVMDQVEKAVNNAFGIPMKAKP